jgi:hypothetical protein
VKGAIILAILERLLLTRNSNWLEVRRPLLLRRLPRDAVTLLR